MGAALWLEPSLLRWYRQEDIALLIARTVLAPGFAAWAMAELVNVVRPLRLFDRRIRKWTHLFIAGTFAGVLGAVIAAFGLALGDGEVHELVILGACGALGTLLVLLPFRRVRAGQCIHCSYDLRAQPGPGSPGAGVCPECGAATWTTPGKRIPPPIAA